MESIFNREGNLWGVFIFFVIITVLPLLYSIISIIYKQLILAILCFIFFCIAVLFIILFWKVYFYKIKLSDDGISLMFQNKTLNTMKWSDINDILIINKSVIVFSSYIVDDVKTLTFAYNKNKFINFCLSTTKCIELSKFHKYFADKEIKNISSLCKEYQDILQKNVDK